MIGAARVSEDGVATVDEGLGEELAEVSEPYNGDLELVGGVVEGGGELGLVVVVLSCVEGSDSETAMTVVVAPEPEPESGGEGC